MDVKPSSFEASNSWLVLAIAKTASDEALTASLVSSSILDLSSAVSLASATTLRIHDLSLGRNSFCHAVVVYV
jgi:hypothetical protein